MEYMPVLIFARCPEDSVAVEQESGWDAMVSGERPGWP